MYGFVSSTSLTLVDFFSVRSIFISLNEHQKVFAICTRMKMPLLVFMTEIKIDFTLKNQIFCFFYALKL